MSDDDQGHDGHDRRRALKTLVLVGGATFACALGAPALVFVAAPLTLGGGGGSPWVRTVRLDDLEEGVPRKVAIVADQRDAWTLSRDVELGAAWLVRKGHEVTALSVVCPHLGCSINATTQGYSCPCHASSFDVGGKRQDGPSPRDMDPLATRVEGGYVLVELRRFRIGSRERVEVA